MNAAVDHPACAPFVAAKLHKYFHGVDPTPARKAELGDLFRTNNMEILPLVTAILRDPNFFDPSLRMNRPRYPVEWASAAFAAITSTDVGWEQDVVDNMGQLPFSPPNVAGWPASSKWLAANVAVLRAAGGQRGSGADRDPQRRRPGPGRAAAVLDLRDDGAHARRADRGRGGDHHARPAGGDAPRPRRVVTGDGARMKINDSVSRRRFLKVGLGAAGAAAAAACRPVAPPPAPPKPAPTAPPPPPIPPAPLNERTLVVIEMAGGNDGYSTVIPYTNGAYYTHRPTVSVPANQVLPITGNLGWHPNLARISHRPMAVVEGVGGVNANESHFEMMRRWWSGDTNGLSPQPTGFFGRICDTIGDPSAPATGVSLGWGTTPALVSAQAVTLSMSPYGDASFPGPGDTNLRATWIAAQRAMANPDRVESTLDVHRVLRGLQRAALQRRRVGPARVRSRPTPTPASAPSSRPRCA